MDLILLLLAFMAGISTLTLLIGFFSRLLCALFEFGWYIGGTFWD